jgi:NitT/TauT family transport system permease protein
MADVEVSDAERGAEAPKGRRRARRLNLRAILRPILFGLAIGGIFLGWDIASHHFASFILPGPHPVWQAFRTRLNSGTWALEIEATLEHLFIAYGITLGIGLPLGIVIGRYWVIEDLTRALLIFLQTVPTIVLIALALTFVGPSTSGVIYVTIASGLTYFTLNVIQGTKSIDRDLVEMARTYRAREPTIMRSVILPSVIPYFLAGARITLGVAWQVTLFGEYLLGSTGVGFQISSDLKLLDTASVFAWGLSIVVLTIAFEYGVFRPMEMLLTRHMRRAE